MPVSTIVMLAAVVAVFAIFAAALAWAQLYTRDLTSTPAPAVAASRPRKRPF
jgi:hypothetical protein